MSKIGSKYVTIEIATESGEVIKVTDENGNEGNPIGIEELGRMYKSADGVKHVSTILHARKNPW